jgi:hypothetical protein
MLLLTLSIIALAVGPALQMVIGQRQAPLAVLEGFMLTAIGGLVLVHIIPHGVHQAGWLALLAAALGLLVPEVCERLLERAAHGVHLAALVVALVGLAGHAAVDGVALAGSEGHMGGAASELALAVILHRIPVGLTIWWLLREPHGRAAAVGPLVLVAGATVGGFLLGERLLAQVAGMGVGLFQGLVGGTLLHVLLHQPHHHTHAGSHADDQQGEGEPSPSRWNPALGLGALCGLALVLVLALVGG